MFLYNYKIFNIITIYLNQMGVYFHVKNTDWLSATIILKK